MQFWICVHGPHLSSLADKAIPCGCCSNRILHRRADSLLIWAQARRCKDGSRPCVSVTWMISPSDSGACLFESLTLLTSAWLLTMKSFSCSSQGQRRANVFTACELQAHRRICVNTLPMPGDLCAAQTVKDRSLGIDFSVPGSWCGNSSSERLCSFLNSREGPVTLTINEAAT